MTNEAMKDELDRRFQRLRATLFLCTGIIGVRIPAGSDFVTDFFYWVCIGFVLFGLYGTLGDYLIDKATV